MIIADNHWVDVASISDPSNAWNDDPVSILADPAHGVDETTWRVVIAGPDGSRHVCAGWQEIFEYLSSLERVGP